MKKSIQKIISFFLILLFLLTLGLAAGTEEAKAEEIIEIHTYEDLLQMAENPEGSYVLAQDIDCGEKEWLPIDFSGTLDGNGYAILNLRTTLCGKTTRTTYDGNMKEYDTSFAGLFSCLENAEVSNLKLLGVNIDVITENPCFAGAIAGYMDNSTISNCEIEGQVSITTTGKSFGTGGIVGFGNGRIEFSKADVTLICVDQNVEDKDEQFMGGAYSNGYIDLTDNEIIIRGYDSDHGYVHDGGLVGMYIQYQEEEHYGEIVRNTVAGFITFYEDNEDRRAYCEAYIGEILGWGFEYDDTFDPENFTRDEIWFEDLLSESGYYEEDTNINPADLILKSHTCENPQFDKKVVESTETSNGYTLFTCKNCDYSYKADYVVRKGTPEPEIPTEESVPESEPEPVQPQKGGSKLFLVIIIIVIALMILIIVLLLIRVAKKRKAEAERRARAARKRRIQEQNQR